MNFSEALDGLKAGKRVARAGWNGVGQSVHVVFDWSASQACPQMFLRTAQGKIAPWVPSITDLWAEDWQEVVFIKAPDGIDYDALRDLFCREGRERLGLPVISRPVEEAPADATDAPAAKDAAAQPTPGTEPCPECCASGGTVGAPGCPACHGTGRFSASSA